jgi:hypothetical protein
MNGPNFVSKFNKNLTNNLKGTKNSWFEQILMKSGSNHEKFSSAD